MLEYDRIGFIVNAEFVTTSIIFKINFTCMSLDDIGVVTVRKKDYRIYFSI